MTHRTTGAKEEGVT